MKNAKQRKGKKHNTLTELGLRRCRALDRVVAAASKHFPSFGGPYNELDKALDQLAIEHTAFTFERAEQIEDRIRKHQQVRESEQRGKACKPSSPKHQLHEMTKSSIVFPRVAQTLTLSRG